MTERTTRPTLLGSMLGIAAAIVILAAMRFAGPILNPILLAIVTTLLVAPIYGWLRRILPGWLAIIALIVGLVVLIGGLFALLALSANSLREGLAMYTTELQTEVSELSAALQSSRFTIQQENATTEAMIAVLRVVVNAVANVASYLLPMLLICLFLLTEGDLLIQRAQESVGPNNPQLERLKLFGAAMIRQFGLRAIVNAITGAGFTIFLLLMGIDYAVLWGVLTFFLSYIPYLGIVIAGTPAVILAFAEFGIEKALAVIAALAIVNVSAENLLSPALMARGLHISTTITFVGFMFWFWLLGGAGAFLAMPLTILVILLLDSFSETQWLAQTFMRPNTKPNAKASPINAQEHAQMKGADEG